MKTYKQYELPNNSKVQLPDGEIVKFLKMDGMYAQWEQKGKLAIGNFESFILEDGVYKVKV
jgi:hypothetical protein